MMHQEFFLKPASLLKSLWTLSLMILFSLNVSADVKTHESSVKSSKKFNQRLHRVLAESGASQRTGAFLSLGFRYAAHDLLDPLLGQSEYGQIEVASFKLRYNFTVRSFWLENLDPLEISSLSPLNKKQNHPSWGVSLGASTVRDSSCDACLAGHLRASGGITALPFNKIQLITMIEAERSGSTKFNLFLSNSILDLSFSFD